MDRRYKDYFIVTFKWRGTTNSPYIGGYMTEYFRFERPVKIHWRYISATYALVSVPKEMSNRFIEIASQIRGVKNIIPYTETKECDFAMWQKILRLPENNVDVKYKIRHCMEQDLFIDWLV